MCSKANASTRETRQLTSAHHHLGAQSRPSGVGAKVASLAYGA